MNLRFLFGAAVGSLLLVSFTFAESAHRLGVGAHYWKTIDDLDEEGVDDIDEDGFSYLATYTYKPALLGLGLDLEWKDEGFAGSPEAVYEPQAYLILGDAIYGAAGIGGYYSDGDLADDPFYAFRVGLDLELLPSIFLDIHGNYRFETWDSLGEEGTDIDTDTVTFGAAIRIGL